MKVQSKKVDGFTCFFDNLGTTLLENILVGKDLIRAGKEQLD